MWLFVCLFAADLIKYAPVKIFAVSSDIVRKSLPAINIEFTMHQIAIIVFCSSTVIVTFWAGVAGTHSPDNTPELGQKLLHLLDGSPVVLSTKRGAFTPTSSESKSG